MNNQRPNNIRRTHRHHTTHLDAERTPQEFGFIFSSRSPSQPIDRVIPGARSLSCLLVMGRLGIKACGTGTTRHEGLARLSDQRFPPKIVWELQSTWESNPLRTSKTTWHLMARQSPGRLGPRQKHRNNGWISQRGDPAARPNDGSTHPPQGYPSRETRRFW
ncbi:hypothetical protein BN1723_002959 [Verticillium longisporum]|uniref:Uncharacterized protein n=1 Tax=Verticillium longisporum TaxID=100787 RepID=A0A0G4LMD8_VERLO|nr:hypothetical protein BN1723_002959 [Verticillium longisporum]